VNKYLSRYFNFIFSYLFSMLSNSSTIFLFQLLIKSPFFDIFLVNFVESDSENFLYEP
jgi:hypothetical protein